LADLAARSAALYEGLPDVASDAHRVAAVALAEDGEIDVTTALIASPQTSVAGHIKVRQAGVFAGHWYAEAVARACGCAAITWTTAEGEPIEEDRTVGVLCGSVAQLLRAERPLLNLLQRACGVATATRAFVEAVAGTHCRILHTRKTTPGLRGLEVRAVLAGGGALHRVALSRIVMIKDNHWNALERAGTTLSSALAAARSRGVLACHVEAESLSQVEAACAAGATRILVDNQSPDALRAWAQVARRLTPGIEVEATGGITLANVRAYAEAGADFVSVGALTHSPPAADLTLELVT